MALLDIGSLIGLSLLLFWAWAIIDVIATDESACRNLNKPMWLVLVVVLLALGAFAWVLVGRPEHAGVAPGGSHPDRWQGGSRRTSGRGAAPAPRVTDHNVTDRRSAELDAQLEAWERSQRDRESNPDDT